MRTATIKSYSKINLHLGILGKIKSDLHKIESLIIFSDVFDLISVKEINTKKHRIFFYGNFAKKVPKKNTISSLLNLLDKKNLLKGRKYLIKIKKNIPTKSGMGGGSMNAATILRFFLTKKKIQIKKIDIPKICSSIGSDVILGLDNRAKILRDDGEIIFLKKKPFFHLILIKPNFGCSTKKIYKRVRNFSKSLLTNKKTNKANFKNFKKDLEKVSFKEYPKLSNIKNNLLKIPNIIFARMTGSGSTLVGYFLRKKDVLNGVKILKKKYKNCWCIASKTI